MGTGPPNPSPRELPLSNQTRFGYCRDQRKARRPVVASPGGFTATSNPACSGCSTAPRSRCTPTDRRAIFVPGSRGIGVNHPITIFSYPLHLRTPFRLPRSDQDDRRNQERPDSPAADRRVFLATREELASVRTRMARRSGTAFVPLCTVRAAIPIALALSAPTPAQAGALPQASQMTVAPVVSAVTPGVVSIATHGAAKAGNPPMRDPAPGRGYA